MPEQSNCAGRTSTLRFGSPNLSNKAVRNDGFVSLMVREAIESSWNFNPDSKLLARIGEMFPHLEPYAGESDLKTFEIFIAGILQWLSMNLLLGSGKANTAVQLRYLGTHLTDDALEWYSHNVEHYTRATHHWTLEATH